MLEINNYLFYTCLLIGSYCVTPIAFVEYQKHLRTLHYVVPDPSSCNAASLYSDIEDS
jgi:hypothetical protein